MWVGREIERKAIFELSISISILNPESGGTNWILTSEACENRRPNLDIQHYNTVVLQSPLHFPSFRHCGFLFQCLRVEFMALGIIYMVFRAVCLS